MTTTTAQRTAAQQNIRQAQAAWRGMSSREHSLAQPQGRSRAKPGTRGRGQYYRIVVRPQKQFSTFRVQDVGRPGHTERLAGRRPNGSWDTQAWLINKRDAHVEAGRLVLDHPLARTATRQIRGPIVHEQGDIFKAKPRRNIPEREKPTAAQRRAQLTNIRKAQRARRKKPQS